MTKTSNSKRIHSCIRFECAECHAQSMVTKNHKTDLCVACGYKYRQSAFKFGLDKIVANLQDKHPNLIVVSDYKGVKSKITVACNDCGTQKHQLYPSIYYGKGCAVCNNDKGKSNALPSSRLPSNPFAKSAGIHY